MTALPLLATELTRDPRLIAGVAVAERLPWLVFILPGGAWADRYDRRQLQAPLDVARGMIVAGLSVLIGFDAATMLAVYAAAAMASAESVVDSSSMALVPALVDESEPERGGGLMSAAELTMGGLIGPALGGLLFATAVWVPIGFDATTFVVATGLATLIPGTFKPATSEAVPRRSMRREIAAGMRWLWHEHLIRNLALISTGLGTVSFISGAVFVLLARDEFGLGAVGFGLLLVPPAIGGLIGSGIAPRFRRFPLPTVLTASVLVDGLTELLIAATTDVAVVAVLLAAQSGAILV
jgi:MFS family permease